jgi:hypothetical protein
MIEEMKKLVESFNEMMKERVRDGRYKAVL